MDGMDSLLSTVQMPAGVPVATVAINGGLNAGLLAIQMLGASFGVRCALITLTSTSTPNSFKISTAGGIEVLISAAGKAAHLGGVLASFTTLPVIGLPIKSSTMDGMDSLLLWRKILFYASK